MEDPEAEAAANVRMLRAAWAAAERLDPRPGPGSDSDSDSESESDSDSDSGSESDNSDSDPRSVVGSGDALAGLAALHAWG